MVELLVPEGQEGVTLTHNITDQRGMKWTVQPGLTARCVHVGVGPEEWHVSPSLVPTHQQISAWSIEETTNIGCGTDRVSLRIIVSQSLGGKTS